jgi:hypothetical protein
MKVNIIINQQLPLTYIDVEVLDLLLKRRKEKLEIQYVNYLQYKCKNASMNIFVHCVNYSFMNNAKMNVLLMDHQLLNKNWLEYLPAFDYVLVKSEYTKAVIESACMEHKLSTKNIKLINWDSPNIASYSKNKNNKKCLLYCTHNKSYIYKRVVNLWEKNYPQLVVLNVDNNMFFDNKKNRKVQENIDYCEEVKSVDYHKIFNECGIHLCLDEIVSYSHFINQAKQVSAIPVAVNGGSNKEFINRDIGYVIGGSKQKNTTNTYGSKFNFNEEDLKRVINDILETSDSVLRLKMIEANTDYSKLHRKHVVLCNELFDEIINKVRKTKHIVEKEYKDEELPKVSIITPTYNREKIFRMAIYNYNTTDYPKDKLEWVIIDDSDNGESIEKLLPIDENRAKYGIKYIKLDERNTIGSKRNIGVENATNEIILCMDDDDYYYPGSIRQRVTQLLNSNKKLVCCTTIGMFDIHNYVSIINVPPFDGSFSDRVAEATMTFYRDFWENNKFEDTNSCEGKEMLQGNLDKIKEISWEKIIVSILHKSNTSDRRTPIDIKPNGNHFGFSEKLFDFIIKIDK